jgi:hypothetical protein
VSSHNSLFLIVQNTNRGSEDKRTVVIIFSADSFLSHNNSSSEIPQQTAASSHPVDITLPPHHSTRQSLCHQFTANSATYRGSEDKPTAVIIFCRRFIPQPQQQQQLHTATQKAASGHPVDTRSHHLTQRLLCQLTANSATYRGSKDKPEVIIFAADSFHSHNNNNRRSYIPQQTAASGHPVNTLPHHSTRQSYCQTSPSFHTIFVVSINRKSRNIYRSEEKPASVITIISTHHTLPATFPYRLLCVVEPGEPLIER